MYHAAIGPRLRWLLRGSRAVVVPNDAAFPYLQLVRSLAERDVPFVLVQEGIRFKLPSETATAYGKHGATKVCVWGPGSAEHFSAIGVPRETLCVTGNSRFDRLDNGLHVEEGRQILAGLHVHGAPLLSAPAWTEAYESPALLKELVSLGGGLDLTRAIQKAGGDKRAWFDRMLASPRADPVARRGLDERRPVDIDT